MTSLSRQTLYSLVSLLFVVSGGLGLLYQIVWFKYLSLFLGNTTYAQTIVLATFMGGLAIGAAWWGRKVDHSKHPLRLYAFLELGIGLYCYFYPRLLELLKSIFISIVASSQLPSDGTVVLLLKLLTCFCSLLIPTILMGGTLPILVRFLSRKLEESGRNIAVLYFLNSFGAVVGSILAGFFFIRILGLSTTIYFAAFINLLVGGFSLFMSWWKISPESAEVNEIPKAEDLFPRREVILALAVAGISGLASMMYEVTWVRMLIPVIGSSTYSFTLMLVAFISGITLGSLIVSSVIQRVKNLLWLLVWCQFGIVISMLAMLPVYSHIPYEFWKAASILARSDMTYPIYLTIQFFFGFLLMIIPTIFLGMSLPLATRIAARGMNVLGKTVGNTFSINTLGAVLGSLLAGLVLIPLFGVKHTIEIGVACNLIAGLLVILISGSISRRQLVIAIPVIVLMLLSYFLFVPDWNKAAMLSGVFRRTNSNSSPPSTYKEFVEQNESTHVLFYKEGTTTTVGVVEGKGYNATQKVLIVNGKQDASSQYDLPTQLLLGQLPCLLHHDPQNVLVVGLGSGVTVGSVLTHPVQRVDCVEISPEVVEASSQFDEVNHRPLSDARTHLFIEDALAYLKLTSQKYDIIISEPSNPWIAGVGNLFTTEFFDVCKRKMNPGGMMVQWFHLYEMNDDLLKMVVRTFQSSFAHVSIWQPLSVDIIMIGSNEPISVDLNKIQEEMAVKNIHEDITRIFIPDATTLLSLEMLSSRSVLRYMGVGGFNTEDLPLLEYNAPSAFFLNTGVTQLARFDERMRCDSVDILLKKLFTNKEITDEQLRNIGFLHTNQNRGNIQFGFSILQYLQTKYPRDVTILARLAYVSELLNSSGKALMYRKMLCALQPDNPDVLENYAWLKYVMERPQSTILTPINSKESEDLLLRSIALVSDTVDRYRSRLADLYFGMQQYGKAADQYERTIQIRTKYAKDPSISDHILLLKLARCLYMAEKNAEALGYALQAVNANPKSEDARDLFYEIWQKRMKPTLKK
jgi:spermidine synthase